MVLSAGFPRQGLSTFFAGVVGRAAFIPAKSTLIESRLPWYLLVPTLMQAAKDLGVVVKGVSFHVGSGATDPEAFKEAIKLARGAFDAGAGVFLIHVTQAKFCTGQRNSLSFIRWSLQ